ncbi:hypothetical protein AN948_01095 [Rhodococcus sp. ADH]|nr:hypothetical protein AN948_01095 [Rhodococcus sp. ADH]RGP44402.1 hypothetical protein AWH04_28575 [Rhodococcus erythropolis]
MFAGLNEYRRIHTKAMKSRHPLPNDQLDFRHGFPVEVEISDHVLWFQGGFIDAFGAELCGL